MLFDTGLAVADAETEPNARNIGGGGSGRRWRERSGLVIEATVERFNG